MVLTTRCSLIRAPIPQIRHLQDSALSTEPLDSSTQEAATNPSWYALDIGVSSSRDRQEHIEPQVPKTQTSSDPKSSEKEKRTNLIIMMVEI